MKPAARIAAAIELLDSMYQSWTKATRIPADRMADQYFRARRYIGSKDRGNIAESVYWILRHKAVLDWWAERSNMPSSARTHVLAALLLRREGEAGHVIELFSGHDHAPAAMTDKEKQFTFAVAKAELELDEMPDFVRLNYPAWLRPYLEATFGKRIDKEMAAMNEQAPVDLRVNTLKTTRDALIKALRKEGFEPEPTRLSPVGIRLGKRGAIFASPLFKQGHFEMQDEGSQMVALIADAQPGQKVIDFCAGAGGKTLALAAQMQNKGRILAWDTSEKRLSQMPERLRRAGVSNTQCHVISSESDAFIKRHKQSADRVVVDAPCSGTGTWRRNPDLKWRFTEQDLLEVMDVQQRVLESAARLVKPGGRLIYATCSLLKCENDQQVEKFLTNKSNFRVVCAEEMWNKNAAGKSAGDVNFLALTPHQDGADGFFAAVIERTSA